MGVATLESSTKKRAAFIDKVKNLFDKLFTYASPDMAADQVHLVSVSILYSLTQKLYLSQANFISLLNSVFFLTDVQEVPARRSSPLPDTRGEDSLR